MDTSKEYVAMCAAAEEIQDYFSKKGNQKEKLIYYCSICEDIAFLSLSYYAPDKGISWKLEEGIGTIPYCNLPNEGQKIIILPSQDQLQDVCPGPTIFEVLADFHVFVFGSSKMIRKGEVTITKYASQFKTAEQLWLAFLLFTRLQKQWTGNKWEKM